MQENADNFSYSQLCEILDKNDKELLKWIHSKQLVIVRNTCDNCKMPAKIRFPNQSSATWVCISSVTDSRCDWSEPAFKNSIFTCSMLTVRMTLRLMHIFCQGKTAVQDIAEEFNFEPSPSFAYSASSWFQFSQEICFLWLLNQSQDSNIRIGGDNCYVRIYAAKFGETMRSEKCTRFRNRWIIGMLEVDENHLWKLNPGSYRLQVCTRKDLTGEGLLSIITRHVLPGTTLVSDGWACGSDFQRNDWGYSYMDWNVVTTNSFENPPARSSNIKAEANWVEKELELYQAGLKNQQGGNFALDLCEFFWRREMIIRGKDPFLGFLECVAVVYNPME